MCVQNVSVYAGTTRTCVSTWTRGASTHGDVLNAHTGAFWMDTRRFFTAPHHTTHTAHQTQHIPHIKRNTKCNITRNIKCHITRNTKCHITRNITQGRVSSPVLFTKICPRRVITYFRGSPKRPSDLTHFQA